MRRQMVRDLTTSHTGPPVAEVRLGGTSALPGWLVPIAILAIAGLSLLGYAAIAGRWGVQALEIKLADQEKQLAGYQARPTCDDGAQDHDRIQDLVAAGKLSVAAGLAETTLAARDLPLCAEAHEAIAALWYSAQMDALLGAARPAWYDNRFDRELVARWHAIEKNADEYRLPPHKRWATMTVADRAFSAGLWALSDSAFRQAWAAGEAGEDAIAFRYSLLRNWGYHLATSGDTSSREAALRLLATAVWVSDTYSLPGGEACRDLETFFGYADCHQAEPDPADPALSTALE